MAKALPKRFAPYLAQAQTQADLQYGPQEAGLKSIFDSTTHDYQQQAAAQQAATASLLGALQHSGVDLDQVYSQAGLTPAVLASIANSPTGQRLAGEHAAAGAALQQQQVGAQAGGQYTQGHLYDQYTQDVGKINDQASAESKARGEYTSSLLDQLIGNDRSARHDANQAAAKLQFTAAENAQNRQQQGSDALIGAGIDPSTGAPLPPRATAPKPAKSVWLPQASQNAAAGTISKALAQAKRLKLEGRSRSDAAATLTQGRPGQQVAGPGGTPVNIPGVPSFDSLYASVALDLAYDGHVSARNAGRLHTARIKVGPLGYETASEAANEPQPPPAKKPRTVTNPFASTNPLVTTRP